MQTTTLGATGIVIPRMGLGCMGMNDAYGTPDRAGAIDTIRRALELGVNHFDTADVYALGANEELLREALDGGRDGATIATKCGLVRDDAGAWVGTSGRPDYIRARCDASLARLGTDRIDLYYLHRADPETPIEESMGAMLELMDAGKIRAVGLSEVNAETLRRAHAVVPISAVQSELSLWTRDLELSVLPACRALGVTFIAYSPLGRGMLTATLSSMDELPEKDYRRSTPRFAEHFEENKRLADAVRTMAEAKGCTPAQLALAWVVRLGDETTSAGGASVVPIPGTKRVRYLEDNASAVDIAFTTDELAHLDEAFPREGAAAGDRYPSHRMGEINR
ncbi:MAG: aldo/keto reductase [Planctomycetota bacterium]